MFTDDYYCTRCRTAIPKAVSDRQQVCDTCLAAMQQAAQAQAQIAQAQAEQRALEQLQRAQRQQAAQDAVFQHDTRKGICPACGSRNISEIQHVQDDRLEKQSCACCMGCFIFWPTLLLIPFLGTRRVDRSRRCNVCGHQWRI